MIKIVFDTNSIISAHLLASSVARRAYDKSLKLGTLLYSRETLTELTQTFLKTKFDKYISVEKRLKAISEFEKKAFFIDDVFVKINASRDPKDNMFLELAICGDASVIVTGDKDLLILNPFQKINIVNPSAFLLAEYSSH